MFALKMDCGLLLDFRPIFLVVGVLLTTLGIAMAIPALVDLAFGHADWINQERMKDWVMFFYNEAPAGCFGSRKKMDAWTKAARENDSD